SLSIFLNPTASTAIYTLSLHDALPICLNVLSKATYPLLLRVRRGRAVPPKRIADSCANPHRRETRRPCQRPNAKIGSETRRLRRSEEHTSELQSPDHLVCRLLLEKKKQ